jgi:tetratricopeptide (TPR) repeat protein
MKKKDLALDLLDMALARKDEPVALATALIALDRMAQQQPTHATTHYASGRVLMLLGKYQLALGAFRIATLHEPKLVDAHYFEGVCQWMLGYDQPALDKLAETLRLDPTRADAYYDAAQIFANRGEHARALELYDWAADLRPDDLGCKKKILQCQIRLSRWEAASKTHDEILAMRQSDPAYADMESFVCDQFEIDDLEVVVVETFFPSGEPSVAMSFVITSDGELVFTVNLESSSALRAAGFTWVLVAQHGDARINTEIVYYDRPAYTVLRKDAEAVIRRLYAAF